MRVLKIALFILFSLTAAAPLISTKLATRLGGVKASTTPVAEPAVANNPPQDLSQYVGSEACSECHSNQTTQFTLTAHHRASVKNNGPADKKGCEACHGPAKNHVDFYLSAQKLAKDGKDAEAQALYNDTAKSKAAKMIVFSELSSKDSSAICLKCHEGAQGRNEERFNYRRSEHSRHGVSCLDCHSSHSPKRTEFLLRNTEPNMCFQCHADQRAAFSKPFHHKVPEGGMKCSDCHNQHGGLASKQLRTTAAGDTPCLKCHADKQGPFVYEHAPIKQEGCQACHTPHGSAFPRLLTKPQVKFLCMECHSNAPGVEGEGTGLGVSAPHDLSQGRYQNCTACHFDIHGSNRNKTFR